MLTRADAERQSVEWRFLVPGGFEPYRVGGRKLCLQLKGSHTGSADKAMGLADHCHGLDNLGGSN